MKNPFWKYSFYSKTNYLWVNKYSILLQGDSGGLLTCAPRTLSGVISFGNECGMPAFPGKSLRRYDSKNETYIFSLDKSITSIVENKIISIILGIYSDVSMYKDWIDGILSTKELPDYEFSPFPKLTELVYEDAENIAEKSSIAISIAILSLISTIVSL